MQPKRRIILYSLILLEFALLNLVLFTFFASLSADLSKSIQSSPNNLIILFLIYNLGLLFIIMYVRDDGFYFDPKYRFLKSSILNLFIFIGIILSLLLLLKIEILIYPIFILPILFYTFISLIVNILFVQLLRNSSISPLKSNIILISSRKDYTNLSKFTKDISNHGYNILGCLYDKNNNGKSNGNGYEVKKNGHDVKRNGHDVKRNGFLKEIGYIKELPDVLEENQIDEVFISISSLKEKRIKSTIRIADNYGVRVRLIPKNPIFIKNGYNLDTLGKMPVFQLRESPLDKFPNLITKRLFDVCFALSVLLLLSPLLAIIALIILSDRKGPVFYKPLRKGEAGYTFKCYKFRTMADCDDPFMGTKSTIPNDPRITTIGKLLRKNDLDELPQFINVLRGEMSVVGPRPHRINLQDEFKKSVNNYMVRSYVKPGITGWAQVNGWRGPTVTDEQKRERVKHDLWYIKHWSLWLDIKIIFMTIFGKHRKKAF